MIGIVSVLVSQFSLSADGFFFNGVSSESSSSEWRQDSVPFLPDMAAWTCFLNNRSGLDGESLGCWASGQEAQMRLVGGAVPVKVLIAIAVTVNS